MLTVKEVHLLIEQGLNTLGIFVELSNLHSQVDLAVNHVAAKTVRDILDTPKDQRSSLQQDIVDFLTKREMFTLTKGTRYWEAPVPSGLEHVSNSYTLLGVCKCKSDDCEVTSDTCLDCKQEKKKDEVVPGYYYVTKGNVKYNGKWYKDGKIFKALEGITNIEGGEVYRLKTKEKLNIGTSIDSLESFTLSAILKNSFRPVLAWDQNKFYIYYSPYRKGSEIPFEVAVNYIIGFQDSMKIAWCDGKTLEFPEPIQRYLIDASIAYLAVIGKQDPNNIVLLKQETI
jgi:hypothetical protein